MIKLANSSIYQKIEAKGKEEAQKILNEGKEQAKALQKGIDASFLAEYEKAIEDAKRANAEFLKTKITQIEQAAKQESLTAKKAFIEKVIQGAHEQMKKMSDNDLKALVIKTIKGDAIEGNETVQVSKSDYSKYQKLFATQGDKLDVLNKELGKGYDLKLSKEPADIDGGFILVGKTYDIDHSYVAMLEDLKEENEAELAKILFGKGE